ncbi:unnamed protein product, partial [Meganyctiphanes norvegica]
KKLSYPAVVSEILGTNNYLVLSDNGPKHVSGDVMSKSVKPAAVAPADDVDRNHHDTVVVDDDNVSVASDISDESDFGNNIVTIQNNNNYNNLNNVVNQNRRGQREVLNLGPAPLLPRLRSGRF